MQTQADAFMIAREELGVADFDPLRIPSNLRSPRAICEAERAKQFGVHANQILQLEREFIDKSARAFANGTEDATEDRSWEREEQLLKKIGERRLSPIF